MEEKYLFSQQEIARLLGISSAAVSQWKLKPIERRGKKVIYYLPDAFEYWKNHTKLLKNSKYSLKEERAKLARAKTSKIKTETKLKELELKEKKSLLVCVRKIENKLVNMFVSFRSKALSIKNKCEIEFSSLQTDQEKIEYIDYLCYELLEELSRYDSND